MNRIELNLAVAFVLALAAPLVSAAPGTHSYRGDGCWHGKQFMTAFSKDAMGGAYTGTTARIAPEGDLWHDTTGKCHGAWTMIGGERNECGTCEYMDPSGDKFFGVYTRDNDGGTWKVLGGTGKYGGMVSTGTWTVFTQFPNVPGEATACFHQTGTHTLR